MTFNLLANVGNIVFICVIVALLAAFLVWTFISNKKKQKAYNETINAVKPGRKVKTIGGICGEVVEINDEENTFVLKTGTGDGSAVSYLKFDKQAIYQTDAKPEPAPAEQPAEPAEDGAKSEPFGGDASAETAEEKAPDTQEDKKDKE